MDNLEKYILCNIDNYFYYKIPIFDLSAIFESKENLLFENLFGDIQRNIDVEHLQNLIDYQENYYKNNEIFSFPTSIILCALDNKLSLLDGQHRYETMKYLSNKYEKNFDIIITVIIIKNIDDYDSYFVAINKNKPVHIYNNISDWKNVIKNIEKYIIDKWSIYIKNTNNPLIPHMNIEKMKQYIDDNNIVKKIGINSDKFINEIEILNNFYRLYWKQYIRDKNYIKNIETYISKCESKCKDNTLYLGIYKNFEWIDRIVYKLASGINYDKMEHICSTYRISIPKKMRTNLWKQYFDTCMLGNCYVCLEEITYDTFQCGHVLSVFYGGKNEYDNLRPICSICNNDMGILDLNEYKTKFHITSKNE
jgi:hypothetical protein